MNKHKRTKPCLGLFIFNLPEISSPLLELSYIFINQDTKSIQKVFQFKNLVPFGNQKQFLFQSLLSISNYLKEIKTEHIPVFYNTLAVSNFLFRMKEQEFTDFKKFCKNPVELFDFILPNQHFQQYQTSKFTELTYLQNEIKKVSQIDKEAQHYIALILFLNSNRIYFYEKCRKFGNHESKQRLLKVVEEKKQSIQNICSNIQDRNAKDLKNPKYGFLQSSEDEDERQGDQGYDDDEEDELQKAIKLSLIESQQQQLKDQNQKMPLFSQNVDEFDQMQKTNKFNELAKPQNIKNNDSQFLSFNNNHLTDLTLTLTNQLRKQEILFKESQEERRRKFEEIQKRQLDLFLKSESSLYKEFIQKQTQELESFQQNIKQLQKNLNSQLNF
ncbi:hypothetical protein ABPG74_007056 [Tetrahymena malaccensis]